MILADANVLIDVLSRDLTWFRWSSSALAEAADRDDVAINPIIYAEISVRFETEAALDELLAASSLVRLPLPYEACFVAGKAFLLYRRRGGARRSPLPDFYIAAHAAVAGLTLLTRDARRYRSYFPAVPLIAPAPDA